MNVKSTILKNLSVIITVFVLFVSIPVFAGTRSLHLTLRTPSSWLKKTVKQGTKIRLHILYNDIELLGENVTFSSSKPSVVYPRSCKECYSDLLLTDKTISGSGGTGSKGSG